MLAEKTLIFLTNNGIYFSCNEKEQKKKNYGQFFFLTITPREKKNHPVGDFPLCGKPFTL